MPPINAMRSIFLGWSLQKDSIHIWACMSVAGVLTCLVGPAEDCPN